MTGEETIFADALAISGARERVEFLDRSCGGDAELRARVEALLAAHERAGAFLELPVTHPDATRAAGAVPAEDVERPGAMVGPYKLLEQIGEGGMGVVFMAEQVRPVRRRVALKIIKPGMDSRRVIARFEAERQALAMMDHPNIAWVLEAGATEAGRPYFVMELVRGVPITEYCDRNRLTPRCRLELFVRVCQAVQHAHQKGIIHRDLKPNNVLVTVADDGEPVPKVIDFGIAKATAGQPLTEQTLFTEFRQLVGTPLYMSPEQAEMSAVQDVDTRSDVYSLGVLLYELLTGTTPFDKARLGRAAYDEVRRIIREEDPPRPSTRLSTLGETLTTISAWRQTDPRKLSTILRGELDWIVMRAMEKDRGRRYETAVALAQDIERYLRDEAVEACSPSSVYRIRKFLRRHKHGAVAALAIAISLVAGIIGTGMGLVQARSANEQVTTDLDITKKAQAAEAVHRHLAETAKTNAERVAQLLQEVLDEQDPVRKWEVLQRAMREEIQLCSNQIASKPDDADLYRQRGIAFARLGEFRPASADLVAAMTLQPQEYRNWHLGLPLLLHVGNDSEYRRHRSLSLQRFNALTDDFACERVVNSCLLLPLEGQQLELAATMIDHVVSQNPLAARMGDWMAFLKWDETARRLRWLCFTKGLAEYRAGRDLSAINWLLEAIRPDEEDRLECAGELLVAMAYSRLHKPEESQLALNRGVFLLQRRLAKPGLADLTTTQFSDWIVCQILFNEAADMFDGQQSMEIAKANAASAADSIERTLWHRDHLRRIAARTDQLEIDPDDVQAITARGWSYAQIGMFKEAAADFNRAVDLEPEEHLHWHRCMPLLLQIGDIEGYKRRRRQALAQFADGDAPICERIAKPSLLFAPDDAELAVASQMADRAFAANEHDSWNCLVKGIAEFRVGNYEQATRYLGKVDHADPRRKAAAEFYAAMAFKCAGQPSDALAAFKRGVAIADTKLPNPGEGDLGGNFQDWIMAMQARKEAEALLKRASK